MKNKNAVVGIFVVIGLALFTVGLFLIGDRNQAFARHVEYYAEFVDLDGISKGSKVQVAGVDAGQVTSIGIPQSPSSRFRVAFEIDERLCGLVRTDSVVTIGTQGVVGDVFLSVRSGSARASLAKPSATLPSTEPLELSEILAKGTGLLQDADGAIKQVSGKVDGTLDDVRATVVNVNDVVVGLKAGRGTAGMLLKDQTVAASLKKTVNTTLSNVDDIVADVKGGRGAAGLLLRDQTLSSQIQTAAASLNHASNQADALLSTLQADHTVEKLDQVVTSTRNTAANADKISQQLYQVTSDVGAPDDRGTSAGTNIRESLAHLNTTTANLADDTEALKHNFLIKSFFRKRGYYNINQLSAEKYRNDRLFTGKATDRTWLAGAELFQKGPTGIEELSPRGKSLLDSAVTKLSGMSESSPIVVEGYWSGNGAVDQVTFSRVRAILVSNYLERQYHIDSGNIGLVSLMNLPPNGLGRPTWDGVCIVLLHNVAHASS